MLKKFWEDKKHLIQLVGILLGAGALFLSIDSPENTAAKSALANIQFVWLLIITVGLSALFIEFVNLSGEFEKKVGERFRMDFSNTASYFVWTALLFLLYNLWIFIGSIYQDSFFSFMKLAGGAVGVFIASVYYPLWRWLVLKIPDKYVFRKTVFSFVSHGVFCILLVIAATLVA